MFSLEFQAQSSVGTTNELFWGFPGVKTAQFGRKVSIYHHFERAAMKWVQQTTEKHVERGAVKIEHHGEFLCGTLTHFLDMAITRV